jgi:hypothetical protein
MPNDTNRLTNAKLDELTIRGSLGNTRQGRDPENGTSTIIFTVQEEEKEITCMLSGQPAEALAAACNAQTLHRGSEVEIIGYVREIPLDEDTIARHIEPTSLKIIDGNQEFHFENINAL